MNNFKYNVDKELQNMQWKGNKKVFDEIYGNKPKKSFKLKPIIVLSIVAVMILGTALAIGFNFSQEYNLIKDAKQAVMLKYGFSPEIMDSFSHKHVNNRDVNQVIFTNFACNTEKVGTYTVNFTDNKATEVSWSNDHIDPKLLEDGNLNAPAWGSAQLDKMRKIKTEFREKYDAIDWSNSATWTLEQKAEMDKDFTHETLPKISILPAEDDIQLDKAIELSKQALIDKYGFSENYFSNLIPFVDFYSVSIDKGESTHKEYNINFGTKISDNAYNSKLRVDLLSPSGEIKYSNWSIDPKDMRLPDGDLSKYEDFVNEYFKNGAFEYRTSTEKADIAQRLKAAGFEHLLKGVEYTAPESEVAGEAVIAAANKALFAKFGGNESVLSFFDVTKGYVDINGQKQWQVNYIEKESYFVVNYMKKLGNYTVNLADGTLEPINVTWSLGLEPIKATEHTWGAHDKYSLNVLPYLKKAMDITIPMLEKYGENTYPDQMSTEEAAAFSKLYIDAGFSKTDSDFSYTLPDDKDIPEAEIRQKAKEVLMAEKNVPAEYFDTATTYVQCYYNYISGKGEKVWSLRYYGQDAMHNVYFLIFDSQTGELLQLHHEDSTMGNG